MKFLHSPIVLLVGFLPASPQVIQLRTILEDAEINVIIAEERSRARNNSEDLAEVCISTQPSLIIQSTDQRRLEEVQSAGGFPNSIPVPVIIAAQDFAANQIRTLLELGATDFITPPFTESSILPRVWRLLRHSTMSSSGHESLHQRMAIDRVGLIGKSPIFLEETKRLKSLARCDITVLIGGETGTGKELIARAIHYLSPRSDRPFVPVDCGAIPAELTESELFGHERGAFTGAVAKTQGLISAADQGTLFLDEVDALNLSVQAKLLRFLQEMEYRSLGSSEIKKADVRLISATNRDLLERVKRNEFRKDLYYRLNVVQLHLPSLRQRREDILLLAQHFATKHAARFNQPQREFSTDAIQKLLTYHWPGNVRELENIVAAAVALCDGPLICGSDLSFCGEQEESPASFRDAKARVIIEFEREYIVRLLSSCNGNVSKAARVAGKNRRAFWELIRKHKISVQDLKKDTDELKSGTNARSRGFALG